jgi:hypothetical protein
MKIKASSVKCLVPVTLGDKKVILLDEWEGKDFQHRKFVNLSNGTLGSIHESIEVELSEKSKSIGV